MDYPWKALFSPQASIYVSAREMARLSGVSENRITHWGRSGLLTKRNSDGYRLFRASEAVKAQAMGYLIDEAGMSNEGAAALASRLLKRFAENQDVVRALMVFLYILNTRTDELLDWMNETKMTSFILDRFEGEKKEKKQ